MDKTTKEIISKAKEKLAESANAELEALAKLNESDEKEDKDKEDVKEEVVVEGEDKADDDKKEDVKEDVTDKEVSTDDDSKDVKKEEKEDVKDDDKETVVSSYRPEDQPATQTWTLDPFKSLSVKEDIAAMFDGAEGLSEDFKTKVATIYEAALKKSINEAVAEIQAHAESVIAESVTKIEEQTEAHANEFLGYVVEEWLVENEVQVETGIRAELAEGLLVDLKTLLETYNVSLPEAKVDLLEEKTKEADGLKEQVNTLTESVLELNKTILSLQKAEVVASLSEGLAATEVEKLKALIEGVEATDLDSFKEKAGIVKESYFTKAKKTDPKEAAKADVVNEDVDANVAKYMTAIHKAKTTF